MSSINEKNYVSSKLELKVVNFYKRVLQKMWKNGTNTACPHSNLWFVFYIWFLLINRFKVSNQPPGVELMHFLSKDYPESCDPFWEVNKNSKIFFMVIKLPILTNAEEPWSFEHVLTKRHWTLGQFQSIQLPCTWNSSFKKISLAINQ